MKFFKKFINLISLFFSKNVKVSFTSPKNKNLLLVDNIALDFIKEPILKGIEYGFISTRPFEKKGVYYVSPKTIFFFYNRTIKKIKF